MLTDIDTTTVKFQTKLSGIMIERSNMVFTIELSTLNCQLIGHLSPVLIITGGILKRIYHCFGGYVG